MAIGEKKVEGLCDLINPVIITREPNGRGVFGEKLPRISFVCPAVESDSRNTAFSSLCSVRLVSTCPCNLEDICLPFDVVETAAAGFIAVDLAFGNVGSGTDISTVCGVWDEEGFRSVKANLNAVELMTVSEIEKSTVPVSWVHFAVKSSPTFVTIDKHSVSGVADPMSPDTTTTESFGSTKLHENNITISFNDA